MAERRRRGDEGMVTAFVVVFSLALLFVTGLVHDGGRLLVAHREAADVAGAAARAGAQELSDEAVRQGADVVLDGPAAEDAACDFLARAGYGCDGATRVGTAGNRVTVTVRPTLDLVLLPLASQSFTVVGTACVARGITGDEPSARC